MLVLDVNEERRELEFDEILELIWEQCCMIYMWKKRQKVIKIVELETPVRTTNCRGRVGSSVDMSIQTLGMIWV